MQAGRNNGGAVANRPLLLCSKDFSSSVKNKANKFAPAFLFTLLTPFIPSLKIVKDSTFILNTNVKGCTKSIRQLWEQKNIRIKDCIFSGIYLNSSIRVYAENGSGMEVYLPRLEFGGALTEYLLWVAEDGSTYWARTNTDGTHDGDEVNQSALYAMQYDEDGLACGAYDARLYRYGKTVAQSPAIDQGSDDAYGYDSTSTNPKVIDMGQPDIGYHYYRRVADDDPQGSQTVTISFRQPTLENSFMAIKGYQLRDEGNQVDFLDTIDDDLVGKDVVVWPIENAFQFEGVYEPNVHTAVGKADGSNLEGDGAGFKLIVDRTPPTVSVE